MMTKQLEVKGNLLSYKSRTNLGGYSYDITTTDSEYPICRKVLKDFSHCLSPEAQSLLVEFERIDNTPLPNREFLGLLPNQNIGVLNLLKMKRCIMCDSVGNGKTVQALTLITTVNGDAIYITKKGLINQVKEEITAWCPNHIITTDFLDDTDLLGRPHIFVTNYEQLLSLTKEQLRKRWKVLVIDEAHSVKNQTAQRSQAIKKIAKKSEYVVMLTGTPIENKPTDLWYLLHILDSEKWASYHRWYNFFIDYEVNHMGYKFNETPKNIPILHSILQDYYIRRVSDREEPTYITIPIELYAQQKKIYNRFKSKKNSYLADYDIEIQNEMVRELYLRQLAIETSKVINTYYPAAKIDTARDLIHELMRANEKVVVFCSFKRPLEILHNDFPVSSNLYDSSQSAPDFLTKPIQLMTFQSGGTGLNLQEAHIGIMLDVPQSSIIFQQAVGRLDRIGQLITPTFYILQATKTVDEKLNFRMETKIQNFRDIVVPKG